MVTVTELNRAPDGRFESLKATGSFTDPSGFEYSGAINPVQVTEEASTFAESDVTVTKNGIDISKGSISLLNRNLIDDFEDNDISTLSNNWDGWKADISNLTSQQSTVIAGSYTGELTASNNGVVVKTTKDTTTTKDLLLKIQIDNDNGTSFDGTKIRVEKSDGTNIIVLDFVDSNNEIQELGDNSTLQNWTTGTTYKIRFSFDFSNNTVTISINGSDYGPKNLLNSASAIQQLVINGITSNSGITKNIYIDDVSLGNFTSTKSGNVLIEWDSGVPADLDSYDLATFQRTLDSETVTIDVEDGSGNVLFSDISQNFDISTVDTSKEVKLRANLSRSNTSNNPTVDYLARRFNR